MPFYIDNVKMPEPALKGVSRKSNKVWSSGTGRSVSGLMNGSIITVKKTVTFKFPPLTESEVNKLEEVVSNKTAFHQIKYSDTDNNTILSISVYFGDSSHTVYSAAKNQRYYTDYTFDAIER